MRGTRKRMHVVYVIGQHATSSVQYSDARGREKESYIKIEKQEHHKTSFTSFSLISYTYNLIVQNLIFKFNGNIEKIVVFDILLQFHNLCILHVYNFVTNLRLKDPLWILLFAKIYSILHHDVVKSYFYISNSISVVFELTNLWMYPITINAGFRNTLTTKS